MLIYFPLHTRMDRPVDFVVCMYPCRWSHWARSRVRWAARLLRPPHSTRTWSSAKPCVRASTTLPPALLRVPTRSPPTPLSSTSLSPPCPSGMRTSIANYSWTLTSGESRGEQRLKWMFHTTIDYFFSVVFSSLSCQEFNMGILNQIDHIFSIFLFQWDVIILYKVGNKLLKQLWLAVSVGEYCIIPGITVPLLKFFTIIHI